jgi:hypothetical protein
MKRKVFSPIQSQTSKHQTLAKWAKHGSKIRSLHQAIRFPTAPETRTVSQSPNPSPQAGRSRREISVGETYSSQILEWSRVRMLYPTERRVSAATTQ